MSDRSATPRASIVAPSRIRGSSSRIAVTRGRRPEGHAPLPELCRRDRDVVEFAFPLGRRSIRPGRSRGWSDAGSRPDAIKSVYARRTTPRSSARASARSRRRRASGRLPSNDFRMSTRAEGAWGDRPELPADDGEDGYFLLLQSACQAVDTRPCPEGGLRDRPSGRWPARSWSGPERAPVGPENLRMRIRSTSSPMTTGSRRSARASAILSTSPPRPRSFVANIRKGLDQHRRRPQGGLR